MFKKVRNVIAPSKAKGQEKKKKLSKWEWLNQNMDIGGEFFYGDEMDDMYFGENEYGAPNYKKDRDTIRAGKRVQKGIRKVHNYSGRDFLKNDKRLENAKIVVGDTIHWNPSGGYGQYEYWNAKVRRGRDGKKILGNKINYADEMNDMYFGENEYGLKLPGLGKAGAAAAAAMKKQKSLIKKAINDNKAQLDPAKKLFNAKIASAKTNVASLKKNMPNMADVGEALQNVAFPPLQYGAQKKRRKTGKNKNKGPTLKQLQNLARRNKVNIYKMRKDRRGYTKTALTKKALKARLSRSRVSYKNLKAPRTRTRTRTRTRKRYVSSSSTRRSCPVGSYRDPYTGNCRKIPDREDLDELDSVNFKWNSDRTFGNKPLSMQYSRYGNSCFGSVPCDCGS